MKIQYHNIIDIYNFKNDGKTIWSSQHDKVNTGINS
jgi:hypothetical protein